MVNESPPKELKPMHIYSEVSPIEFNGTYSQVSVYWIVAQSWLWLVPAQVPLCWLLSVTNLCTNTRSSWFSAEACTSSAGLVHNPTPAGTDRFALPGTGAGRVGWEGIPGVGFLGKERERMEGGLGPWGVRQQWHCMLYPNPHSRASGPYPGGSDLHQLLNW